MDQETTLVDSKENVEFVENMVIRRRIAGKIKIIKEARQRMPTTKQTTMETRNLMAIAVTVENMVTSRLIVGSVRRMKKKRRTTKTMRKLPR